MIKLISGKFCSRCHMIAPLLKSYAENNGLIFKEVNINEATPSEIEGASSLPVIWFDDKQIEYDEALAMISNNNG